MLNGCLWWTIISRATPTLAVRGKGRRQGGDGCEGASGEGGKGEMGVKGQAGKEARGRWHSPCLQSSILPASLAAFPLPPLQHSPCLPRSILHASLAAFSPPPSQHSPPSPHSPPPPSPPFPSYPPFPPPHLLRSLSSLHFFTFPGVSFAEASLATPTPSNPADPANPPGDFSPSPAPFAPSFRFRFFLSTPWSFGSASLLHFQRLLLLVFLHLFFLPLLSHFLFILLFHLPHLPRPHGPSFFHKFPPLVPPLPTISPLPPIPPPPLPPAWADSFVVQTMGTPPKELSSEGRREATVGEARAFALCSWNISFSRLSSSNAKGDGRGSEVDR
ncbi:unnamed protein product [Closterium sp. Naga37s-1]|nr:unnamed protein product [Closterium sp. Naga37s-1]